jgi:hypothetical protein
MRDKEAFRARARKSIRAWLQAEFIFSARDEAVVYAEEVISEGQEMLAAALEERGKFR